jgi:fructosamine-3-kinase
VPEQPASILHGDLWSGNSTSDADGQPAIIDPAAYYGWAEADLAMMVLFGSPGGGFWEAYNEVRPLEKGWRERFSLYNLYHLLNHLNLFGRGYYSQVMSTVRRFS